MRLWDKETGVIDHAVAEKWKKYDLLRSAQDQLDDARPEGRRTS